MPDIRGPVIFRGPARRRCGTGRRTSTGPG